MTAHFNGRNFVTALKKKIAPKVRGRSSTWMTLGSKLGYSWVQVRNWENRRRITPRLVANLVAKAMSQAQRETISPIVEFFEFDATNEKIRKRDGTRKRLKYYKLFNGTNKYEQGLRTELKQKYGVYVFYDSRGRALYVGKAVRQFLWDEIHLALNRRRDVQRVMRVNHPSRNVRFMTSDEKRRRIYSVSMQLHELARYISAYEVSRPVIGMFEAMLVRSFANDILNVRMEQFAKSKRHRRI